MGTPPRQQLLVRTAGPECDRSAATAGAAADVSASAAGDTDSRRVGRDPTLRTDGGREEGVGHRERSIFIEQSPLGFIEWDADFRIVGLNAAAESILGYDEADLRGASWRRLIPEPDHEEIATSLDRLSGETDHRDVTVRFRRADGEDRYCRCYVRLVEDDGEIVAAFSQFRDVTTEHETERQLARYASTLTQLQRTTETLLEATTPAEAAEVVLDSLTEVFEFDIAGVWLASDDRSVLEPVAVTEPGRRLIEELPTYTAASNSLSWQAFVDGETRIVDDMAAEADRHNPETPIGSELVVPLGAYGVLNVGSEATGAFGRQDAHRLEGWAKTVTAALARIEQLATLTERERELERERERLDTFTSTVTHDLRNPLGVASGRLALLAEECDSDHIDPIERALDRMDGLIEEMIELSRQGETVGETEPVDLGSFPRQCWGTVETSGATLTVESETVIEADRSRLSGLFENLFHNGISHGGDDVHIRVGDLLDGEGFYVEDDGQGVPAADRERIFERGFSTRTDGTGYGLAIVREIVDAHGWTIDVTESDAGGARFEIRGVERHA